MLRAPVLAALLASAFACTAFTCTAHADLVQLDFSGGNGTPLTITLPQPVSYTVTNSTTSPGTNFGFLGVGNLFGGASGSTGVAGSMSYTTNGGGAIPISLLANYSLAPSLTPNDLSLFEFASPGVDLNDVLVLSSGSVTTGGDIPAAPASGLYQAILVDGNGNQLGVGTVPEPASLSLLALAGIAMLRRRW